MIGKLIELCARNRGLVIFVFVLAAFGAVQALRHVQLDAIPDLSDPQVIVFTEWMGRCPTLIEDQVTYPIAEPLLAAPQGRRTCAASRCSGCRSSTSSSRRGRTSTGRARACSST